jgi:hypothetical protein
MSTRQRITALALAGSLAAAPVVRATETARGTVFEDLNGDGRRRGSEPGLAGVRVSNGRDVVVTDALGHWQLPVVAGDTLFVVKPPGFEPPVSADNLPRFFFNYVPEPLSGTAELRYPGREVTGPLPESIDFPLLRVDEPDSFRAILWADPQPQTEAEVDFVRDDVATSLVGVDARFGITLGDIMYDDLSLLPRYNAIVGRIGIPWYNVPGNHDVNYLSPNDITSLETFRRVFGPPWYSFDVGRAHIVVLDTVMYLGRDKGVEELDPLGAGAYRGAIGSEQLAWLAADLEQVPADRLVVIAMHIPLHSVLSESNPRVNVVDRELLYDLLEGRPNLLGLAGHTHTAEHSWIGPEHGFDGPGRFHLHTLATVSGSWWSGPLDERGVPTTVQRDGSPNGWYELLVDGVEATVRFRPAGAPASHQMRVLIDTGFPRHRIEIRRDFRHGELSDLRITQTTLGAAELVVNLFDGGPRSRVWYRIADRPWIEMASVARHDPFVQELIQRHANTVKPWVEPVISSHLWAARLPTDLAPGTWSVEIRAVDEYGVEHSCARILEIEPDLALVSGGR